MRGYPSPNDVKYYIDHLGNCFFSAPGDRFLIPDVLPIPLPYYGFLLPGFVLALREKRFEIALLATIPVLGAFVATCFENRLLLPIPFWMILMGFSFDFLLRLELWRNLKIVVWGVSALLVVSGLAPSLEYIHDKTKNPFSIYHYSQEQVAISRFLRKIVAGQQPENPPRLERDEFNRIEGIPDPPYETFICQSEAYSIIHLFLHDYDGARILSFCDGAPLFVMDELGVWSANKRALADYAPSGKDLKLIWERHPNTNRIIEMIEPLRDLGTEESVTLAFGGKERQFYVLNIGSKSIPQFQERVRELPDSLP
jgi:hypothetical protein